MPRVPPRWTSAVQTPRFGPVCAKGSILNAERASGHDPVPEQHLLEEVARLQPDLHGFPVAPLLDPFVQADEPERLGAFLLADRCLAHWIAQLDQPINPVSNGLPDVMEKIACRQRGARDALARVHAALARAQTAQARRA